jgi:hypothetical protein
MKMALLEPSAHNNAGANLDHRKVIGCFRSGAWDLVVVTAGETTVVDALHGLPRLFAGFGRLA